VIKTVGDLRDALHVYPDNMPLITSDDSLGAYAAEGVVLRHVRFSREYEAVTFVDEPDPPDSGPELGEGHGWHDDCEADAMHGLYIYPDAAEAA
jgi:hypothetical protein